MLGILVLGLFLLCGTVQVFCLCRKKSVLITLWLGLTAGLTEMMWLPSLFAFAFGFTLPAQLCALGVSAAAAIILSVLRRPVPMKGRTPGRVPWWLVLALTAVIGALSGYLQYTHTFQNIDSALYVGQSTYGDLCMHVSFATGLIGQSYPAEYTLLPGTVLGYPYLTDALSATMLLFGSSIPQAFAVPGTIMTILVFLGFFAFARETTGKTAPALLALGLLLFNGGLGFLYTLDLSGETGFAALKNAVEGYYQAPTNFPEDNLRWVNALCDLLVPQRTLLAGWVCLIPAIYLLYTGMKNRGTGEFVCLGVLGGSMVMIHTHSFVALALISLGAFIDRMIRDRENRLLDLKLFALYGAIACVLSLPQLAVFTFPQTLGAGDLMGSLSGSTDGKIHFLFNWVNNLNGSGSLADVIKGILGKGDKVVLRDGWLWFWIKNVGPMFLILPLAALTTRDKRMKALALGALIVFIVADNVVFQMNIYDNNKLFYTAYLVLLPGASALLCDIFKRLRGIRGRCVLAAGFVLVCTASGAITIYREAKSSYRIFSAEETRAGEFIRENTLPDGLFLCASNHNNVPAVLGGKKIVCGSSLYLHWHGLDYSRQEADAVLMLQYPEKLARLYEDYAVDYVYVSSYEWTGASVWNYYVPDASLIREHYTVDEGALAMLYPCLYEGGEGIRIYAVSDRARQILASDDLK